MPARSPQLDELARTPDGPGRAALLRGILGDCAADPDTVSAVFDQLAKILGAAWPAAVLRGLRGVDPRTRPHLLITLAPHLNSQLAREALDLVALFAAPVEVEIALRELASRLADTPVVALLRVLRLVEEPPLQARLLCRIAAHAAEPARGSLLAAAARVAQRTASEPERLAAAVEVAVIAGGDLALATWDLVAPTRRRDVRLRLLAALAPVLSPEQLTDRMVRLAPPLQDIEALLEHVRGGIFLEVLTRLAPVVGPASAIHERLLAHALERMRGLDLLDAIDAAMQRAPLPARLLDTHLGRALAELDDAQLGAAAPRLAGFDPARLDALLGHMFAGLQSTSLVVALERFRRCCPAFALPDAALVRAASTCPPATRPRVERLLDDHAAGLAPVVLALRRGGSLSPEQLRRGLTQLADLPRKDAAALAALLTAGSTLDELLGAEPPDRREHTADLLFAGLMTLRCGVDERVKILALLLPRLSLARARDALLTGLRWQQSAEFILERMLAGRSDDDAADILASLGASRSAPVTRALDAKLASLTPDLALALASRLLRADSRVLAVQRRLALLARQLPAARAEALRGAPALDPTRLAAFLRSTRASTDHGAG